MKEIKIEDLEKIAKAWKETIEHFGNDFPFEKDLQFKIIDKNKEFLGKIKYENINNNQ